jgi:nitroimidazol reductase NimA-like FMN-containing flavoprotein (pyridoxamine 5'-phosphate oxidase superfamily)
MSRLTRSECWQLLSGPAVGRLGVVVDGAPEVYPVNYVVDGETVVYRADGASRLDVVDGEPAVCFQIDAFDTDRHHGWSVLVKGTAQRLPGPGAHLPPGPGPDTHWVRITPSEVSGRKIWRGTADMEPPEPRPAPS